MLRRALHPLYRKLETSVHPLRYLFLEVTQRCNLDCRHCGSDCGRQPNLDELPSDEWLSFLEYLPKHFDARKLMLVVTGGEPLCHPEFNRLVDGIGANRLAWGMVTNGWALNRDVVARCRRRGLVSLTISLDGLRESHDWLRGRLGSYQRAVEAIRVAVDAGLTAFDVVTCVSPRNLDELPEVAVLLQSLGVRRWRLFSIFPKGRARADSELLLDDGQLGRMLAWIADARKRNTKVWQVEFSCEGYLPGSLDREVRSEPYFCRAGICIGSVLCDGAMAACPNISRDLVQGNIRSDDFKTIWEGGYQRFRQRDWMKTGECETCTHWARCQGNSMHLWDDEAVKTVRCFLPAGKQFRPDV